MKIAKVKIYKNIESLSQFYFESYLDYFDKHELENNWWEALKFFFDHSFDRGRRDELSKMYCTFTIDVLDDYYLISNDPVDALNKLKTDRNLYDISKIYNFKKGKKFRNCIKDPKFSILKESNKLIDLLTTNRDVKYSIGNNNFVKENVSLQNELDLIMVLDVLDFIVTGKEDNIYSYIKNQMENGYSEKIFKLLNSITGIGDKIASFVMRDIGLLNQIKLQEYSYVFPVDTWVAQVAAKIGCKKSTYPEIKKCLIKNCVDSEVDPLKFAAGTWYLGANSFDILLDHLGEIEL